MASFISSRFFRVIVIPAAVFQSVIFGGAGKKGLVEALGLHAKQVDDVGLPIESVGPVVEAGDLRRHLTGHERARGQIGDFHAETAAE